MTSILPEISTEPEFIVAARDGELWRRALRAICERHGIAGDRLSRYERGSTIVVATGDGKVVKLFAPYDTEFRDTEWGTLAAIAGKLPVATPEPIVAGELEGWPYLVMTELPGTPLCDCWESIPEGDRLQIMRELGEGLAALHELPIDAVLPLGPAWDRFIAAQREGCLDRQRSRGVAEEWLEQIPPFLERVQLTPPAPPVILHTEVMRDHLLARPGPDRWRLSGMFDFEPAMVGHREYELASLGLFVSAGEGGLLREVLAAYGYDAAGHDEAFARRVMVYALLHRYSNLKWYLDTVPTRSSRTLEELALAWWGAA